ncbi:MAG: response regulator [Candidatus Omnitrophica bacterium]|nr:response regulator [Candidatus Omnitrophota bacterium]
MAKRILVVDDDTDIRDVLKILLESEKFEVEEASNGKEALVNIHRKPPDLVITDYVMPDMDGEELCRHIKRDILLRHIPVIMLTGKKEDITDKVKGIDAGADDYIVKTVDEKEFLARVKMVIRRTEIDLDANPLTRLPGNVSILNEIESRIKKKGKFAVCYIDLDKFKSYNDKYGFEKGDRIIQETARVLIESIDETGKEGDFIGHVGGDDFVIVTDLERAENISKKIIEKFDSKINRYYTKEDLSRGYIMSKDRKGNDEKTPIMSVSVAVVTNINTQFEHVAEVVQRGAEVKEYTKTLSGSNYAIDRRS